MLTREADYALRTIDYLVHEGHGEAVSAKTLADVLGIPYRFERQILARLRVAGLLQSKRGGRGGVTLAADADAISLLDVLAAVDDRITSMNLCTSSPEGCTRADSCRIHPKLRTIQKQFLALLAQTSLRDLAP